MKNFNGVPPRGEVFIIHEAQMIYGHDPYTYHEIPLEDDVLTYYVEGVPPSDAV